MLSKVNSLVEKGNVSDVLYVANGLEELFKQLPNNRQNIESFYSVYLKLIDRLFGEDVTTIGSDLSLSSGWIRGSPGGWLRLLIDNYQLSNGYKANTLSSINRNSVSSLIGSSPINNNINTNTNIQNSTNTSPVTKLLSHLSPTSAMFDLVAKIQGGFEIKLLLLPSKAQMYISDHPAYPCLQSDNHAKIFHGLLKIPIHSANQVLLVVLH